MRRRVGIILVLTGVIGFFTLLTFTGTGDTVKHVSYSGPNLTFVTVSTSITLNWYMIFPGLLTAFGLLLLVIPRRVTKLT